LLLRKQLLILKIVPRKATYNFCSGFPSLSLLIFSNVRPWPAFATIFRITDGFLNNLKSAGGYRKAGISILNRITGRILKAVSDFIEASRNFFYFLHKNTAKKCETIGAHTKSIVLFLDLPKKYLSRVTIFE
jgi:hypothetical protein